MALAIGNVRLSVETRRVRDERVAMLVVLLPSRKHCAVGRVVCIANLSDMRGMQHGLCRLA